MEMNLNLSRCCGMLSHTMLMANTCTDEASPSPASMNSVIKPAKGKLLFNTYIRLGTIPDCVGVVVLPRSSIVILSHNWHLHSVARHSIMAMQLALKQVNLVINNCSLAVLGSYRDQIQAKGSVLRLWSALYQPLPIILVGVSPPEIPL